MTVTIEPSIARGHVEAPPSKSLTHRYLICAALAGGESLVRNPASGEDIDATIRFLETAENVLDCGESGSTLRFVLPICLLSEAEYRFTGSTRLLQRPLRVYEDICREQGLRFENTGTCLTVQGPLKPGAFRIPGNLSSQFVSGLLFALPLLEAPSLLRVLPPVESAPYIDLTLDALRTFGIVIEKQQEDGSLLFRVPAPQQYRPADVTVEGDYSAAAVFDALNLLGGRVTVGGLKPDSLQGDRIYRKYFDELSRGTPTLELADCPDLAPLLFVLAELFHGAHFTGTEKLRYKESDRLAAMEEELGKYRAWRIAPDAPLVLNSHNDHRVAMALSLLLTRTGGVLTGAECVRKSLPTFYEELGRLGIRITKC